MLSMEVQIIDIEYNAYALKHKILYGWCYLWLVWICVAVMKRLIIVVTGQIQIIKTFLSFVEIPK